MDFKEKYEEALERARANYELKKTMGLLATADTIEAIFPELRESEDERIRKIIFNCVYECCDTGYLLKDDRDSVVAWLKTLSLDVKKLNEDVAKLCSNEWSKEDEEMLARLLDSISIGNDYEEMRNWLLPKLKSLRPQPKWKPSEEQMEEYNYWYRNFIKSGLCSPTSKAVLVLGELLEQLKKLMEE